MMELRKKTMTVAKYSYYSFKTYSSLINGYYRLKDVKVADLATMQ